MWKGVTWFFSHEFYSPMDNKPFKLKRIEGEVDHKHMGNEYSTQNSQPNTVYVTQQSAEFLLNVIYFSVRWGRCGMA